MNLAVVYGRVLSRVEMISVTGCWIWMGNLDAGGYGRIQFRGRLDSVHRVAYLHANGAIPHGLELDHLCRVRCCANPDHLEPVTRRENVVRGVSPIKQNMLKQACPKCGGPYDYLEARVGRRCRRCRNAYFRARGRAQRGANRASAL